MLPSSSSRNTIRIVTCVPVMSAPGENEIRNIHVYIRFRQRLFRSLANNTAPEEINEDDLIVAKGEPGICRVVCFSPRHDLTLASLGTEQLEK
jgi:galactose-1-phosphate uridylyltransferase